MKNNLFLIVLVILIVAIPMFIKKDAAFEGADGAGGAQLDKYTGAYKEDENGEQVEPERWFTPIWEPPSGEIESMIFSVQVAIGAIIFGYGLGVYKERSRNASNR